MLFNFKKPIARNKNHLPIWWKIVVKDKNGFVREVRRDAYNYEAIMKIWNDEYRNQACYSTDVHYNIRGKTYVGKEAKNSFKTLFFYLEPVNKDCVNW